MSEFSRNIDTDPISKRDKRRIANVKAVVRGLVSEPPFTPFHSTRSTVGPAEALEGQIVMDIEPSGAGLDENGDYTTGRI